jgi:hypothetical protein
MTRRSPMLHQRTPKLADPGKTLVSLSSPVQSGEADEPVPVYFPVPFGALAQSKIPCRSVPKSGIRHSYDTSGLPFPSFLYISRTDPTDLQCRRLPVDIQCCKVIWRTACNRNLDFERHAWE